jgi:hypothetical protein
MIDNEGKAWLCCTLVRNQVVFGFMEGRGMMEKINMQGWIGLLFSCFFLVDS